MSASILHFVLCDFKSGPAWVEREIKDMSREETIKDIKHGQLENVRQVLAVDMETMNTQDVTAEILNAAADWDGIEVDFFVHPATHRTIFHAYDDEGNHGYGFDKLEALADCRETQRAA